MRKATPRDFKINQNYNKILERDGYQKHDLSAKRTVLYMSRSLLVIGLCNWTLRVICEPCYMEYPVVRYRTVLLK